MKEQLILGHMPDPEGHMLAVGTGGAGCRVIRKLQNDLKGWDLCIVDDHPQEELDKGTGIWNTKGLDVSTLSGALEKTAMKHSLSVVIAGLGGYSGYNGAMAMSEVSKSVDLALVGIFILPFKQEGVRLKRAYTQLGNLKKTYRHVILVRNDKEVKSWEERPFNDYMGSVDKSLLRLMEHISDWYKSGGNKESVNGSKPPNNDNHPKITIEQEA